MGAPAIVGIVCGDQPEVWEALGFTVEDGSTVVGGVRITLTGEGGGLVSWVVSGVDAGEEIDGLSTLDGIPFEGEQPAHPNGIVEVDHVVVMTPDHPRTMAALEAAGFEPRRQVEIADAYGAKRLQGFFRPLGTIIEVVGPAEADDEGPAGFFGLCFTASDLEATAAAMGDLLKAPKPAVQKGRLIATVPSAAGSGVPLAVMSPHVPA